MIIAKAVGKSHPNPIDASGKKFKFNPGINNSIEKTKEVYTIYLQFDFFLRILLFL